jgi:hypothetical protein
MFTCIILSKIQKISSFIVITFTCLLFSLARMSNPEVEVRTFKQQGGEFERCLVPNYQCSS